MTWRRLSAPLLALALGAPHLAGATATAAQPGPTWGIAGLDCQYERVVYRSEASGTVDIVIVGSSIAFRGLYTRPMEGQLPGTEVFNAAFPGGDIQSVRFVTSRVILPLLEPGIVVIAISSRDLNMVGHHGQVSSHRVAISQGATFARRGDIDFALDKITSGTRRAAFTAALRRPDLVTQPLDQGWRPVAAGYVRPGWLHVEDRSTQCNQVRPEAEFRVFSGATDEQKAAYRAVALDPFDLSGGLDHLESLIRRVRQAGATPIVVDMPVTLDYRDAHPGGAPTYDGYRSDLQALTAVTGVLLVDGADFFGTSNDFHRDMHHMNVWGARTFSRALADVLAAPPASGIVVIEN